jgi:putative peptidoglycan lipid II flippase
LPLALSLRVEGVREALRAFGPALAGRGVVQLSAYLDQFLASLLAVGAVGAIAYAQRLYLLPVALFGMSVAAAALPDLARRTHAGADVGQLGDRLGAAVAQTGFLVLPSAVALSVLSLPVVAAFYQTGEFGVRDVALVATVLAVYALGLPASTLSRVLQSGFFALGDTRTPARRAAERVALSTLVALPSMWWLDRIEVSRLPWAAAGGAGRALSLGAVGLAAGASLGAWYELLRLRAALSGRLPPLGRRGDLLRQGAAALLALAVSLPAWLGAEAAGLGPIVRGAATLLGYGLGYLGAARLLGVTQLGTFLESLRRARRGRGAD